MSADSVQSELNQLYKHVLTRQALQQLDDIEKLSAPLLLSVFDSYLQSKLKVMYIGKETNHWLTHKSRAKGKRGLPYLINDYDQAFSDLLKRYYKQMSDEDDWPKSNFFSQYKNIRDQLTNGNVGTVIWNNLFKMSYDENNGHYAKNSIGHSQELWNISKQLFIKELEILNPDILIFVTGSTYDKAIKDFLPEYETIDIMIPKKLWKFKYRDKTCYRTVHPDSSRFIKKDERQDYYQIIINDIVNPPKD